MHLNSHMQYVNVIVCSNSIDYFGTKQIASSHSFGASFKFNFPNYLWIHHIFGYETRDGRRVVWAEI
jgi:hypothetical protein